MTAEHSHKESDQWSDFYAIPKLVRQSTRLIRRSQRDGTFDLLNPSTQIALRTLSDKRVPQEASEMTRKELRERTYAGLGLLREMHQSPKYQGPVHAPRKLAAHRV